jgi:DNA polymerase I
MAKKKEKLMIIDGNAIIHRSFHALPPTLRTKSGQLVNAVYGFSSFLLKAWKELKPDYIVLTLDKKGPTFRHEKYKEYKATRVKAPDDLYAQIPLVKEVAEAFNIPIFELSGFEADDLIGTIAKQADENVEKIIVTGDMDTMQLVNSHTKVFAMGRGLSESVLYDEAKVLERYSLSTDQMIDYKGLRGDPSDNIPGVKGIGEKTATTLLQDFKTLEGVYENLESPKIKDRIRELLKLNKENAFLSKDLATIERSAPIEFNLEACRAKDFEIEKVSDIFSKLEFKTLLPRVQELVVKAATKEEAAQVSADKFARDKEQFNYQIINNDKSFATFLAKLEKQKSFTVDTETTGLDPLICELLGVSFSWKEGEAYFVSIFNYQSSIISKPVDLFNYQDKVVSKKSNHPWLAKLKPILENPEVKKSGHNIKYDWRVLRANGVDLQGVDFDSMVASYLLNPGSRAHNLDAVTFSELGFEKISKEDLLGSGQKKTTYAEVAEEKLGIYSCEDADFTHRLVQKLSKHLKEKESDKLFNELEIPLIRVLSIIEDNGVKLDTDFLSALSKKINKKIAALEKKIWELAGGEFNVSSTQQLKEVLFEKLNISTLNVSKTKTGFSTASEELEKLKNEHEIIPLIQEYRELSKIESTYASSLPELVNAKTGRVHASFNQTVTATGRLSSSDPNLQNIPIRTELGQEIRKAFIAEPGWKIVALDYSQIELRLAAHLSGDQRMIETFERRQDIHTATAAAINNISPEEVTSEIRREAKAINFGILYGQGPYGLSQAADIPFARAKEFIDQYFVIFKDIKKYTEDTVEFAKKNGYVETMFGRRRYLPEINSQIAQVRSGAERMAINTPLQGTSADMTKKAMILVQELIEKKYPNDVKMIIQVHDELVFEIKENKVHEAAGRIQDIMCNVLPLKVPVVVDVEIGDNWGEMEKVENKK